MGQGGVFGVGTGVRRVCCAADRQTGRRRRRRRRRRKGEGKPLPVPPPPPSRRSAGAQTLLAYYIHDMVATHSQQADTAGRAANDRGRGRAGSGGDGRTGEGEGDSKNGHSPGGRRHLVSGRCPFMKGSSSRSRSDTASATTTTERSKQMTDYFIGTFYGNPDRYNLMIWCDVKFAAPTRRPPSIKS